MQKVFALAGSLVFVLAGSLVFALAGFRVFVVRRDVDARHDRSALPASKYPMNVAVVKTGPGVTLSNGDGIQELSLGHPVQPVDQIVPQKGEQHVAAPEDDRADLQEDEEQRKEAHGRRAGRDSSACRERTPGKPQRCAPLG